jgi:hypothetical protein
MKIALLGAAGFIGRIAAQALSARAEVGELILVDYNIRDAKRFAKALSPKCRWAMADAARAPELARLLTGVNAVANAVGPCAEYEKRILLTCASMGTPAASIGDGTLSGDDRREVHDAFRREDAAAVSGCGMMPGWTELLSAHFLAGGRTTSGEGREPAPRRYLFCSLDRYGGYAFFRRTVKDTGREATAPPGSPAGGYFSVGEDRFGLPPGRPAGLYRGLGGTLGALGPVGKELSAAFLFWLRGSLGGAEGAPAAAAGVWMEEENNRAAAVEDTRGRLAGVLLAEAALKLASGGVKEKGLLPLPFVIGREEAERIAVESGGRILAGSPPRFNAG